jgi:hypothetical protein
MGIFSDVEGGTRDAIVAIVGRMKRGKVDP